MNLISGIYFILVCFFLLSCGNEEEMPLTIACASNMRPAMAEIEKSFESNTGIECQVIYGSSGMLATQIRETAPYNIFVSADIKFPAGLYDDGLAQGEPVIYARGKLMLWTCASVSVRQIEELAYTYSDKIAIPNPDIAPYGRAAEQAIDRVDIRSHLNGQLVYGENVSQANQFVSSGNTKYGFTSNSTMFLPATEDCVFTEVDSTLYDPIDQSMVIIKRGIEDYEQERIFYEFMLSESVKEILTKFGYDLPK